MFTLLIVHLVLIRFSAKVIFVPYEIPQNLKYKEKITFGLTIEQLFWLGTFGPDITFQAGKDWHAIEVETGKTLEKNPTGLNKKIAKNDSMQHLKNWFFVLTDAALKPEYERLHETYGERK